MKNYSPFENASHVVASLWDLDRDYLGWTQDLPPEFSVSHIDFSDDEKSEEVYGNYCHIYSSLWIARNWNNYRSLRIIANELLCHQISHLLSASKGTSSGDIEQRASYRNMLDKAITTLHTLIDDTFASVPFFLSTGTNEPPKTQNGNLILWPVYIAGQSSVASDEMRQYAARRIRYIAETMGILQAVPLAKSFGEVLPYEPQEQPVFVFTWRK